VNPIRHDHYGVPEAPLRPFRPVPTLPITELPVAALAFQGRRIACGGGGFFRLLPYRWSRFCLGRRARQEVSPAIFYFHPWEIDPDQPRAAGLPLRSRLRHYVNLNTMEAKLRRLMADFRWDRIDRILPVESPPELAWTPEKAAA
jgi:polysaccharide deacetylase family protein (PEP-CTERM system associated)